MTFTAGYILLVILLPVMGSLLGYLFKTNRPLIWSLSTLLPGFLLILLVDKLPFYQFFRWEWVPSMEIGWRIDKVSAVLIGLVYFISSLVHLFSSHYMKDDPGIRRFYLKLGFFTSCMLGLLASDHLMLVFIFWELVGFSSYLLIGYWFQDEEKASSARVAFMINRVADAFLLVGIILMIAVLKQPYVSEIVKMTPTITVQVAGFCILLGAFGKSAQFPFFGWLPKAMAGPTPVSALIHAATMVTVGVFMMIRVIPILSPEVKGAMATIGSLTGLMAAISALMQHDIKKVLAYSTISQLGYMMVGIGVGAFQASLFHLWTHAFFKAGLFLAAGVVIHYMHKATHGQQVDPQDMRNMGGLRQKLPVTHIVAIIYGLALSGLPFFSGFLSKEGILAGSLFWANEQDHWFAYLVTDICFVTAFVTPIYIVRLLLLTFYGENRTELATVKRTEPIVSVGIPLVLLAICSVWLVNSVNPFNSRGWLLNEYLFAEANAFDFERSEKIDSLVSLLSIVFSTGGVLLSLWFFRPATRRVKAYADAVAYRSFHLKLWSDGWYLEKVYAFMGKCYQFSTRFVARLDGMLDHLIDSMAVLTVVISKGMAIVDREIVDGLVRFSGWSAGMTGKLTNRIQSTKVQSQVVWLVLLVVIIIFWIQYA